MAKNEQGRSLEDLFKGKQMALIIENESCMGGNRALVFSRSLASTQREQGINGRLLSTSGIRLSTF